MTHAPNVASCTTEKPPAELNWNWNWSVPLFVMDRRPSGTLYGLLTRWDKSTGFRKRSVCHAGFNTSVKTSVNPKICILCQSQLHIIGCWAAGLFQHHEFTVLDEDCSISFMHSFEYDFSVCCFKILFAQNSNQIILEVFFFKNPVSFSCMISTARAGDQRWLLQPRGPPFEELNIFIYSQHHIIFYTLWR